MLFKTSSILRAAFFLASALPFALTGAVIDRPGALNEPRGAIEPRGPPSSDPFYQPPAGFESKQPGDVLRSRRIIAAFFGFIPDPVEAYQVLYRTTAVDGSAIATVTTIFVPKSPKKDRFISYHTAYDSSGIDCSPSYGFQLGSNPAGGGSAELLVIQIYLLQGYIVASPDYEGPDAAFSAGHLSGIGVLDGMRAVKNFGSKLGLSKNPKIVGTGYSGGAIATGWSVALHRAYAPELQVVGWSAGGVPANLTEVLLYIDGTVTSGFEPIAVAGLLKRSAYGAELQPLVDKIVTPAGKAALALGGDQCAAVNLLAFPFQSILDTKYQSMGRDLLWEPTLARILANNTLGVDKALTPTAPFLQYHAEFDEIIPYAPAAKLRQSWCDFGATVKFTNYAAGGHGTTAALGFVGDVVDFTRDAFAGNITSDCTSRTVLDDQLDPLALGVSLEPLVVGLINWIAGKGKKDANFIADIKNGKNVSL